MMKKPAETDKCFIDAHVHVLPPKRLAGLMRWIHRAHPQHPVPGDVTENDITADLRREGVSRFFNFVYPLRPDETGPLNDFNLDFCARTPEAVPFGSMHVENPDKPDIAGALFERGFVGLKFHPFVQKFDPWDERMEELYDYLEEAGRPVFLHTGFEEWYKLDMPPEKLGNLMSRHPKLPAVFVHMMFPALDRAWRLLDEFPNLYMDATNVLAAFRPELEPVLRAWTGRKDLWEVFCEGLEKHAGRVLFGSDHPAGMGSLRRIYADPENLGLPENAVKSLVCDAPMNFLEKYAPEYAV